ncbi:MAG TPA: lysophospholipid acyltransferase family protein [Thermoanaerobaculia bacterium]
MLRTVWVVFVSTIATLIYAPLVTVVALLWRSNAAFIDRLIRQWARAIVRSAGIDLRVEGQELLDPSRRYIFLPNHASYFDIPCIFAGIEQPTRFMAKASLFKIPIFGWGLSAAGFIPVDRKNRKTAVQSFDLAASRIREGHSIVIFPEEGRTRTGKMKPFQRGGFLLALKSGLPIMPLAIAGTWEVMPATRFRVTAGPVTLRIAPPIETESMSIRAKDELMETTRQQISMMLGRA